MATLVAITDLSPGARAAAVAHLRDIAAKIEAGATLKSGGLLIHDEWTLDANLELVRPKPPKPSAEEVAARLRAQGYCRTSRRHRMVSRLDRPDWLQHMARQMGRAVADFYRPNGEFSCQWEDHYRRCFSQDTRTVSDEVFKLMPSSNEICQGYKEKM